MPFAGELRFDAGGTSSDAPSGLVESFDDALRFYAASGEASWSEFASGVRVDR